MERFKQPKKTGADDLHGSPGDPKSKKKGKAAEGSSRELEGKSGSRSSSGRWQFLPCCPKEDSALSPVSQHPSRRYHKENPRGLSESAHTISQKETLSSTSGPLDSRLQPSPDKLESLENKEELDLLRSSLEAARKEYEEALKDVPQEYQSLVKKGAEKQVKSALKGFLEGQQGSDRSRVKQRIEETICWFIERSLWLKERPSAIKEIYRIKEISEGIGKYCKQSINFISKDIKELFERKLEDCIIKFDKSYLQTKWSYKYQSGIRWRTDCEKNEKKVNQCLNELQELKKDLDLLYSLEEARKEHERTLYYVPQKYQFLVRKLAETQVAPALKEYNLVLQEKQQGCDRSHAREHIEEASCWLKERSERYKKPIEDLIEKIDKVLDDVKTHINSIKDRHVNDIKEGLNDIKNELKDIYEISSPHNENTIKDKVEKIINNLNEELFSIGGKKRIKENLKVIYEKCPDESYKASIEGSIAMITVMLDHGPTFELIDLLKGTHQHALQQFYKDCNGETKPPTRTIDQWTQHFKETSAQMADVRADYQRVESDPMQLMQSLTRGPITSEWEQYFASYDALVRCMGNEFETMNPDVHQQMLIYKKGMESHKKLKEILDEKLKKQEAISATARRSKSDLATAGRSKSDLTISEQLMATREIQSSATRTNIKNLLGEMKKMHKAFEESLRDQGWLEKDV
jgi:hypothetical protein